MFLVVNLVLDEVEGYFVWCSVRLAEYYSFLAHSILTKRELVLNCLAIRYNLYQDFVCLLNNLSIFYTKSILLYSEFRW